MIKTAGQARISGEQPRLAILAPGQPFGTIVLKLGMLHSRRVAAHVRDFRDCSNLNWRRNNLPAKRMAVSGWQVPIT